MEGEELKTSSINLSAKVSGIMWQVAKRRGKLSKVFFLVCVRNDTGER